MAPGELRSRFASSQSVSAHIGFHAAFTESFIQRGFWISSKTWQVASPCLKRLAKWVAAAIEVVWDGVGGDEGVG